MYERLNRITTRAGMLPLCNPHITSFSIPVCSPKHALACTISDGFPVFFFLVRGFPYFFFLSLSFFFPQNKPKKDFYMMDSGLGMVQTSNGVMNHSLYDLITTSSLLAWQRVRVASAMASTGKEWWEAFKTHASGTYVRNVIPSTMTHQYYSSV